ncbi:hypothetical protein [Marinobacter sp. ANT_B65]|uniref:hypothetical protein n=1 Tax=Marinobacter sp. ANT_B65 TaxID=2039467 RepID=UPI000BBE4D82|nr:hypothetical protein [Marinobacter sp. ANT_B65]PCM43466.1 hypothetical protein CPA50_13850 [Marinobacter sp. ANT_B65]
MTNFIEMIPYETPERMSEAAFKLANIIGISKALIPRDTDYNRVVASLAGIILYRHLDGSRRREVMEMVHSFSTSHRAFCGQMEGKIANILVQARWEKWSLTNRELEEIVEAHRKFGRLSSVVGANPGAYGVGAATWSIIKHGASTGGIVGFAVSVILVGVGEASYQQGESASAELQSRHKAIPANRNSLIN